MKIVSCLHFRPAQLASAPEIHHLYSNSPTYFHLIGMEVPTLSDVERELEVLEQDPRRRVLLLERDGEVVGYLDYKLPYPEEGAATISLLLIREDLQGQGLGARALGELESQIKGQVGRLFAVVYGDNPAARRFWLRQGFAHLRDGGPSLSWYVKELI
ncbi:GNAT family N-acetyltransferase [Calidithermus timidus]|jgi:RimJ/RimL family protein N-acetyltransferase|uniref:GNAT family N-acetyltransferase n=1 Tax=Calidithermus timidus TaxID=307124 RepID=UPI0004757B6D|nr:GNAT family N-acetyltransferase [Calidithermus timidus]